MKLAIAYSTKDQVELTEQTFPVLRDGQFALFWCDGSREHAGQQYYRSHCGISTGGNGRLYGGADAAIAWKLSTMLAAPQEFEYLGLVENDCLLDEDWLTPTMELFEKGKADGLSVGAVSARSYVDRVLIQRDGYAVMQNIGAGFVIFTREAAEIVLRSFRTAWWPVNRLLWAQLSGIDVATYACFRGNEQMVTTDWQFEAQLASHGLASLALTPARCRMIGQNPPLAQQGLELVAAEGRNFQNDAKREQGAFDLYRANLAALRSGYKTDLPGIIHRDGAGQLFFAHQLGYLAGQPQWQGTLELGWVQGFGPFSYRAGPGGASLSARISGSCSFLCSGGDAGASIRVTDTRSGFEFAPSLPNDITAVNVPGGPVPRTITLQLSEGAVFHGLSTADPQLLDETFRFDWSQLPEAR